MASEPPEIEERTEGGSFKERGPWILRIVVGVVVVALGAFLLLRPSDESNEQASQTLPEFDLPLLSGDGSFSTGDLQGKPVVINFWASWCGPCREETPLLQETWEKYQNEDIVILGVNVKDTTDGARDFMEEFDVSYPVVVDEDQELFDAIAPVDGLPQTFFVDGSGNFLEGEEGADAGSLVLGAIEEEELEAQIQALLETGS